MGTSIKMKEYFEIFASDFSPLFHHLVPYTLELALFVCLLEVMLGWALLFRYRLRTSLWVLFALVVYFGMLTFYSASQNKVTDCGCFGDAIPLTPWESFWKDVALGVLVVYLLFRMKEKEQKKESIRIALVMLLVFGGNLWAGIHVVRHLPFVDFRAYKVGTNIPTAMKNSAPLKYKYIMEKNGKTYEFMDYPSDTTYIFKEMELLNPEAQAKITDFSLWSDDGDFTQQLFQGDFLLIVSNNVEKASPKGMRKVKNLVESIADSGIMPVMITASPENQVEALRHDYQLAIPYYFGDDTVLKAMIRSNPGVMLLRNGTVLGKWAYRDLPSREELQEIAGDLPE